MFLYHSIQSLKFSLTLHGRQLTYSNICNQYYVKVRTRRLLYCEWTLDLMVFTISEERGYMAMCTSFGTLGSIAVRQGDMHCKKNVLDTVWIQELHNLMVGINLGHRVHVDSWLDVQRCQNTSKFDKQGRHRELTTGAFFEIT
jgi:hypothetical protein